MNKLRYHDLLKTPDGTGYFSGWNENRVIVWFNKRDYHGELQHPFNEKSPTIVKEYTESEIEYA